jgi:hypothetical protein
LQQVWIKAEAKKRLAGSDISRPASRQVIQAINIKIKIQKRKTALESGFGFGFVYILPFFSVLGSK